EEPEEALVLAALGSLLAVGGVGEEAGTGLAAVEQYAGRLGHGPAQGVQNQLGGFVGHRTLLGLETLRQSMPLPIMRRWSNDARPGKIAFPDGPSCFKITAWTEAYGGDPIRLPGKVCCRCVGNFFRRPQAT